MTHEGGKQRGKRRASNMRPQCEVQSLIHVGECTAAEKVRQPADSDEPGENGALSLLLNELVTFQAVISGHFVHRLAFLPNNLFDFSCDLLRLLSICGLHLMCLLLFRLGLWLEFCLLAALWL